MNTPRRNRRGPRPRKAPSGDYVLIARGPDGRPRLEKFAEAAAYRARLRKLPESPIGGVSIDEIVELLDL